LLQPRTITLSLRSFTSRERRRRRDLPAVKRRRRIMSKRCHNSRRGKLQETLEETSLAFVL
jgi:hypothetical protein